jgi:SAM-dependent methyltransferase
MQNPQEFDSYRETYGEEIRKSIAFMGSGHDFYTRVKADYFLRLLDCEPKLGRPLRVLDVGCGHGLIHPLLLQQTRVSLDLHGVDVAGTVIEAAKVNNPGVTYAVYDGKRLPYSDSEFDVAFAICVLHHVEFDSWMTFLNEMMRVIKSDGLVVIFEHNPLNPVTAKVVRECPLDKNAILLKMSLLKRCLRKCGVVGIGGKYILFTPFANRLFRWLDLKLGWLPLGAQYLVFGRKQK